MVKNAYKMQRATDLIVSSRRRRINARIVTLIACLTFTLSESVIASSISKIHQAWNDNNVQDVIELREVLDENTDPNSEFMADYMVATAQCSSPDPSRQRAGLALLRGLLGVYPDLKNAEIGSVYVAIQRCQRVVAGLIKHNSNQSADQSWIDPKGLVAMIEAFEVATEPGSNDLSDSDRGPGTSPNPNIDAEGTLGTYSDAAVCPSPCDTDDVDITVDYQKREQLPFDYLSKLGQLISNHGENSLMVSNHFVSSIGTEQGITAPVSDTMIPMEAADISATTMLEQQGTQAALFSLNISTVSPSDTTIVVIEPPSIGSALYITPVTPNTHLDVTNLRPNLPAIQPEITILRPPPGIVIDQPVLLPQINTID